MMFQGRQVLPAPVEAFSVTEGGYDWADFHVYLHPTVLGSYVVHEASGCSCTFYTAPTTEELYAFTPLDAEQVRRALFDFLDSRYHRQSTLEYVERWIQADKEKAWTP
jgi:hypothetical protein